VWGVILFRSATTITTPALSQAIAVLPVTGTGTITYTDSGLTAGTYHYNAIFFTKEGKVGSAEGDVSGTCT